MIAYRSDPKGTAQILKVNCRDIVVDATRRIAANVADQRPGTVVVTRIHTTDRAAGAVTIAEPEGRLLQVRDGIFTRAAGSIGAEVRLR